MWFYFNLFILTHVLKLITIENFIKKKFLFNIPLDSLNSKAFKLF